uniref:glycoside hydrolase family 97 catalytic domain-containing protein n=1 Tax=Prevotella sp. TaxID=59823 RepID=UPI0040271CBE
MNAKLITPILALCCLPLSAKVYTVQSLLGDMVVNINVDKSITWDITKGKTLVLKPSVISLQTDRQTFGVNPKVRKVTVHNYKNDDNGGYQQLLLSCNGYDVEFRVYLNAAAYRIIPKKMINKVVNETSEYRFAGDYQSFVPYVNDNREGERWCYSFESYYDEAPLSKMYQDSLAITPLAVCLPEGKKAVVMESDVENYPGMYLLRGTSTTAASTASASHASSAYSLHAAFPPYPLKEEIGGYNRLNLVPTERANYIAEKVTRLPWRIVLVTDEDKQLVGNDIAKLLGPQCRIKDTSWIKPGKVAWDWWNNTNITGVDFRAGINTETYKYFVDFAKKNGLEYIIIDEGWSDPEDLLIFSDKMDMAGIINYAKQNGVGVILWSSWRNLIQRGHEKMEEIMKYYGDMGVKGFKVDFFDRDDQKAINSVYEVAECAAKHHLLLDFHGMRPFGVQFAYPNIVNFEGVKGLENSKWEPRAGDGPLHDQPRYDVTIPFLRALPGCFDYTPGAMMNAVRSQFFGNNDHPMSQGTRVHQMAMYTIFDAPLQMLADSPTKYMQNQECTDFIAQIPTVYDQVVPLDGKLGEYVVVAKRKGVRWYIAAMNNWQARDLTVDLSLLIKMNETNNKLEKLNGWANIFADGINADREATDYKHTQRQINSDDKLQIHLAPGGGWTAIVE